MRLELEISNADALKDYWKKAPQVVGDELEVFMIGSVEYLEGEWRENAPVGVSQGNAGGYRASINAQPVFRDEASVVGTVGTANPYAIHIEEGTNPRPGLPNLGALAEYVEKVWGEEAYTTKKNGQETFSAAVWGLATHIKLKGTQAQHIAQTTWEESHWQIEQNYHDMMGRLETKLGSLN